MAELERGREVQLLSGFLDGRNNRLTTMAGIAAPEASGAIEDGFSLHVEVVHVLGASNHTGALLEGAVGCKTHPEGFEIVG